MISPTVTKRARDLYEMLRKQELVDISFSGIMGDAVWVGSSSRRAYRLHELSDGHLGNIVCKYYKNNEKVPQCLLDEYTRRNRVS